MGSEEENNIPEKSKAAVATQELPSTPYPDWASPSPMQAYYGAGASTPPFFPSTVASSPPPLPYLWSGQPIMAPYGTPLPYPALYPHGGIYGHPSMALAQGTIMTATETEGKSSDGKDKVIVKNKGSSGNAAMAGGKSGDGVKATSGSANDCASQSGESGSDGSTEASDENNHQECSAARKKSFDQMIADGANAQQNNTAYYSSPALETSFAARGQPLSKLPITVPGKPAVTVPTTNLNIGMDIWNSTGSVGSVAIKPRPNAAAIASAVTGAMVVREVVMPEQQWMQDERELKRQKRKQSNRESARRSRLRKQAECEELAAKVESLNNDNRSLKNELQRLAHECEKLRSDNTSLLERLARKHGNDAVSSAEVADANASSFHSADEGVTNKHDSSRGNSVSGPNAKFFSSNGKHECAS